MSYVKSIEDALEYIKSEKEKLEKKISTVGLPAKPLLPYNTLIPASLAYQSQWFQYKAYYDGWTDFSTVKEITNQLEKYKTEINAAIGGIKKIQEQNLEIIAHNNQVKTNIIEFMKICDIPSKYWTSEFKSNRSMKKTTVEHAAGFMQDINRIIQTNDYAPQHLRTLEKLTADVTKVAQEKIAAITAKEKVAANIKAQEDKDKFLAVIKVKYNISFDSDASDLLEHLLDKCKYLRLADTMYDIRGSFDRFDRHLLDGFEVVSDTDKEIDEDISECIENWDGDGRIFRDTAWNYDRIFELVNEDLYKDYVKLKEYVPNNW